MKERRRRFGRTTGAGATTDLSPLAGTFLRGLSLGALVGAAVAGSALWRRARQSGPSAGDKGRPPTAPPASDGDFAQPG